MNCALVVSPPRESELGRNFCDFGCSPLRAFGPAADPPPLKQAAVGGTPAEIELSLTESSHALAAKRPRPLTGHPPDLSPEWHPPTIIPSDRMSSMPEVVYIVRSTL